MLRTATCGDLEADPGALLDGVGAGPHDVDECGADVAAAEHADAHRWKNRSSHSPVRGYGTARTSPRVRYDDSGPVATCRQLVANPRREVGGAQRHSWSPHGAVLEVVADRDRARDRLEATVGSLTEVDEREQTVGRSRWA